MSSTRNRKCQQGLHEYRTESRQVRTRIFTNVLVCIHCNHQQNKSNTFKHYTL